MSRKTLAATLSLMVLTALAIPALAAPGDFALEQKVRQNMGFTTGVSVQADNGRVLLSGRVDTLREKDQAVAKALSTQGVTSVAERIEIISGS